MKTWTLSTLLSCLAEARERVEKVIASGGELAKSEKQSEKSKAYFVKQHDEALVVLEELEEFSLRLTKEYWEAVKEDNG